MSNQIALKNECGTLMYEIFEGKCYIHLDLHKWSVGWYKTYLVVFEMFMQTLHEQGFNEVYAAAAVDNLKLQKFEKMFGFVEVGRDDKHVVLCRPTIWRNV